MLDDRNGGLDHFYAALWRTERGVPMAITRILHYGDSPTTADLITGDTRQLLQKRFGDAGHGFTLIGKPWAWYEHRGVELSSHGWQMDPGTRWDLRNGLFGLGGVAFSAGDRRLQPRHAARPQPNALGSLVPAPAGRRQHCDFLRRPAHRHDRHGRAISRSRIRALRTAAGNRHARLQHAKAPSGCSVSRWRSRRPAWSTTASD